MKRLVFLLIIILVYSGCKEKKSFKINGVIEGKKSGIIIINRLDLNTPVLIDSVKISKKGTFHIKIRSNEPDFYQLSLTPDNFVTLLAEPGEKIKIQFSSQTLYDNYTVSGSEGSEKLRVIDENLINTKRKLDSLSNAYTIASSKPGFDQKGPELETEFNELVKLQRMKNIEFIITNTTSLASIKAVYQRIDPETYVLYNSRDLQFLKILSDSLKKYYPNSKHVQALTRDFQNELTQMNTSQIARLSEQLEPIKLNPDLKNINGKRISLESLKGKYVLLTFWSVHSQDCINENMQLKELYKMYNKKGFEIYQINIDADTSLWKSVVKYEELPWINTRENDPSDPVTTRLFNVRELPSNFLFDKEGNIESSNLHGKTLKLKLEQLFNK